MGGAVWAGCLAVIPVAITAMVIGNWSRAAAGGLARNRYRGVRTEATLVSERAWVAGNRAALRVAPWYLLTTFGTGAALTWVVACGQTATAIFLGLGELAAVIGPGIVAVMAANRAARAAESRPDAS